ncbi:hypothetical protein EM77_021675 [Vibrio parahaemolyticus]|nr:hypothetical protein [Vibrio parahaemolyticus]ODY09689.1 hypothetical protein BBM16_19645 [Vibrio parahaemolyticus]OQU00690.1 hypothetical protein EM64_022125 [Vibrio parahaemolyticus]OQU06300.1 hypothetical protein EM77_021675 [Vibrio parahaemolyticus]OXD65650.1 hypothetical protein CA156_20785 [Vibrio parahaemolyticus]
MIFMIFIDLMRLFSIVFQTDYAMTSKLEKNSSMSLMKLISLSFLPLPNPMMMENNLEMDV